MESTQIEMPKYECHKVVHALKIEKIVRDGEFASLQEIIKLN